MESNSDKADAVPVTGKFAPVLPTISIGFNYAIETLSDTLKDQLKETLGKWIIPLLGAGFAFVWPKVSGMGQEVVSIKSWEAIGILAGEAGVVAILASLLTYRKLNARVTRLERKITSDKLTGFLAFSAITEILPLDYQESRVTGKSLSALLLHLDDLSKIREKWGAAIAEQTLKETAALLRTICRSTDQIFRYKEASEILIVAPATPADPGGLMFAQRLCKTLQAHSFKIAEGECTMKVHIGVSGADPRAAADPPDNLLARAEDALRDAFVKGTLIEMH